MKRTIIGVAGTAKNTGKTMTLMALLKILKEKNAQSIGLTGIGYDGESFDNITGLPKPRIDVSDGMIVAVAERCLKFSRAKIQLLHKTAIQTPLGKIVIGRVEEAGKLVLAGPVKGSDLREILDCMGSCGAGLIFVDGAFGRMAPFSEADGLVLATGASRSSNISELALESGYIAKLLSRPVLAAKGRTARFGPVLSEQGLNAFFDAFATADTMFVEGLLSGRFLAAAVKNSTLHGKRLIFDNPLKLLLAGEINQTNAAVQEMEQGLKMEIGVEKTLKVIAVTVNPYYPKYHYTTHDYEAAFVDKAALQKAIGASMGFPCYNVMEDGGKGLLQEINKLC